jgi:hypothetical protein
LPTKLTLSLRNEPETSLATDSATPDKQQLLAFDQKLLVAQRAPSPCHASARLYGRARRRQKQSHSFHGWSYGVKNDAKFIKST